MALPSLPIIQVKSDQCLNKLNVWITTLELGYVVPKNATKQKYDRTSTRYIKAGGLTKINQRIWELTR